MIKVGTDFSGIGSPEAALRRLGIPHDLIFGCEIDKYARKSYSELNFPDILYDDITTRDYEEVPELDLYCAGFPCQSFSIAGKRGGFDDTRGTLFFNVAEFIKINQPKCFILENVKGLLSHDNGRTYQTITDILTNGGGTLNSQMGMDTIDDGLGYHVYTQVLNTKDYGIPQNRERIFIVGFKYYRDFRFPKKMDLELKLKDILQDNPNSKYNVSEIGVKYMRDNQRFNKFKPLNFNSDYVDCITARCSKVSACNNFIEVNNKYYLSDKTINRIKRSNFGKEFTDVNKKDVSHTITSAYSKLATDCEYIQVNNKYYLSDKMKSHILTPSKGDWKTSNLELDRDVAQCINSRVFKMAKADTDNYITEVKQLNDSKESGGKQPYQQNRVYDVDGLAPSLVANLKGERSHNINTERIRRLTPLECWRLQGFTDDEFNRAAAVNSDTQLYKQAGNSITVNVMAEILKKIYLK